MQGNTQKSIRAHNAHGSGHVRGIAPGHTFTLENHPWHAGNVEYLAVRTHFCIENVSQESQRSNAGSGSGSNASPLSAIIPIRRADLHFVPASQIPAPPQNAYTGTNAPANASAQRYTVGSYFDERMQELRSNKAAA